MTTSLGRVGVVGATLGWKPEKKKEKLVSFGRARGRQSALLLVASRLVFGFGFVFSFLNAIF